MALSPLSSKPHTAPPLQHPTTQDLCNTLLPDPSGLRTTSDDTPPSFPPSATPRHYRPTSTSPPSLAPQTHHPHHLHSPISRRVQNYHMERPRTPRLRLPQTTSQTHPPQPTVHQSRHYSPPGNTLHTSVGRRMVSTRKLHGLLVPRHPTTSRYRHPCSQQVPTNLSPYNRHVSHHHQPRTCDENQPPPPYTR